MKISVIIPTYNRKEFVERAVLSVINQTYRPYEIIVVDDGSTDGTAAVARFHEVTYLKIKHSGFPGFVRNYGVKHSTGDYLAFLDSDDIWHSTKLEEQVCYCLTHPNFNVVHTKEKWVMNGNVVSQKKRKHKREGDIFQDSLQGCIIGPSTVLLRRATFEEFGGFNPKIEVGEDYDLWLRVTNKYPIDYIGKELITKFAGHGDQLSFKYGYIEPFKITVLEELIKKNIFTPENQVLAIESLNKKYDIIISGCKKKGKEEEVDSYQKRKESFLSCIK